MCSELRVRGEGGGKEGGSFDVEDERRRLAQGGMSLGWAADGEGRALGSEDNLEDTTAHAQHPRIILERMLEAASVFV